MRDEIPKIADNPKTALESFIHELEIYYYPWYDSATSRNYYAWFVAQAFSLLSGFAAAVIAAVMREEQFKSWSVAHIAIIVVPLLGSLASTYLVQSRVAEMEALRENGREVVQRLANQARVDFAAASTPEKYTEIHRSLVAEVSTLEREQSRGFQRIIPRALSFGSHGSPRRKGP